MNKKTLKDVDVKGKRVLVRCDFNVPIKGGAITDDTRITAALPTIRYLLNEGAAVILCSHLGRPDGKVDEKYTLAPVFYRLNEYLGGIVEFARDVVGDDAKAKAAALKSGKALLLENLRYLKEEEANDPDFSRELASFCDIYVNDAFGAAHRAHASTEGITNFVKESVAGFLMEKEIMFLSSAIENPKKPFVALMGGAKVSDKIKIIDKLLDKVDKLIIGGGMAFTFLSAAGIRVGKSLVEHDKRDLALSLMDKAQKKGVKFILPVDFKVVKQFPSPIDAEVDFEVCRADYIPDDMMGVDIDKDSQKLIASELTGAGTIFWNGPFGVFENPQLSGGTRAVARAVADSGAVTIVGGGDSAAAITQLGFADKITHISTGGGASLELLEGKLLPGLKALSAK